MCDKWYLNLRRVVDLQIFKKVSLIMLSLLVFSGCFSISSTNKIDKTQQLKKKIHDCSKNIKQMDYSFSYVLNEFEQGYFLKEDILGAKAQLFLIKNKSKSVFAQNILAAEKSYNVQYQELKNKNCTIEKLTVSPLQKIKNRIKELDTNNQTVFGK